MRRLCPSGKREESLVAGRDGFQRSVVGSNPSACRYFLAIYSRRSLFYNQRRECSSERANGTANGARVAWAVLLRVARET